MNKPVNLEGASNWEPSPNNLEPFWMGFTPNRAFKKRPRLIARAQDMHYYDMQGRPVLDATAGLWCSNAGHCRPKIVEAIEEVLDADEDDLLDDEDEDEAVIEDTSDLGEDDDVDVPVEKEEG